METNLHGNEFKFHKPEKWRNITKIDWKIDQYKIYGKYIMAADLFSVLLFLNW